MLCVSVKRNLIWISRTHLAKLDHCYSPKTNKRESIAFLVHKLVSFLDMDLIDHGHLVWLLTSLLLCLLHSHLNLCENHCDACIVFLHFAHHLPSVSMCTHAVKLSIFPPHFIEEIKIFLEGWDEKFTEVTLGSFLFILQSTAMILISFTGKKSRFFEVFERTW